ncbi:UPF0481 protein At3g47200-like [Corylus avellana]|uniref:UPF0481 protein At3g47200-like n=1 Tax=Corylus avellana TaxID=13451 RepID=UPI00286CFF15|nr:UPF0481 protein At3g47200-like [Corylus avellana]XP_059434010.1 UPF0481 protein At3g47200-like [Corylus avellana]
MACPASRDSIENEAECEDFVIHILPDLPREGWLKDTVIYIPPELPPAEWPECCIYRVPKKLRKVKEEAYTPKLVSIGPFHYGREELRDMQMHKLRYFMDFCRNRTSESQKSLLKIIEEDEKKIRHCYSEEFRNSSIDFVKMILLDAIFIIELFLKTNQKIQKKEEECDYILRKPLLGNGILHDLILLENQLPFFVLEKLYRSTCNDNHLSFLDLFCDYFTHYKWANYSFKSEEEKQKAKEKVKQQVKEKAKPKAEQKAESEKRKAESEEERQQVNHFTDLVRLLYCPSNMEDRSSEEAGRPDTRFCATKLDDAGFNFKGVEDHSRPLLDIKFPWGSGRLPRLCFSCCLPCLICCPCLVYLFRVTLRLGGSLEVTQLVIDYETQVIFRNLMALEQCHYPSEAYICSYVWLLDRLINTEHDVDLLVKKKVISNNLGNNAAVATLINELSNQIVATTSTYNGIARSLNVHYEDSLPHLLATLKRQYFPNIFRGTATIIGLIVLGFTLWNFIKDL